MITKGDISSRGAKNILEEVIFKGDSASAKDIAMRIGVLQENNEDALTVLVQNVIKEHKSVAEEYQSGKENALQFLIGQGMKQSKGSANPEKLYELFTRELTS